MAQVVLSRAIRSFSQPEFFDLAAFFGGKAEGDFAADPVFHGSTLFNVEVTGADGQKQLVIPSDLGAGIDAAIASAKTVTISYVTRVPGKEPLELVWDRGSPREVTLAFPDGYQHVWKAIGNRPAGTSLKII